MLTHVSHSVIFAVAGGLRTMRWIAVFEARREDRQEHDVVCEMLLRWASGRLGATSMPEVADGLARELQAGHARAIRAARMGKRKGSPDGVSRRHGSKTCGVGTALDEDWCSATPTPMRAERRLVEARHTGGHTAPWSVEIAP